MSFIVHAPCCLYEKTRQLPVMSDSSDCSLLTRRQVKVGIMFFSLFYEL